MNKEEFNRLMKEKREKGKKHKKRVMFFYNIALPTISVFIGFIGLNAFLLKHPKIITNPIFVLLIILLSFISTDRVKRN